MKKLTGKVKPEIGRVIEKALAGEDLDVEDGETLLKSNENETRLIIKAADYLRKKSVGNVVTYVINRNINFTNICYNKCKFCAFYRSEDNKEAYLLTPKQVKKKTKEAIKKGATEICMQGGINPSLGLKEYVEFLEAVRKVSESIHIHAFSPAEINHIAEKEGEKVEKILNILKENGLNSVPGTAAEILVNRVRRIICPKKIEARKWEETIKSCHHLGIPTTATIMYGHVETPKEISEHLVKIRKIQKETSGFTELVPLAFANKNTELENLVHEISTIDHFKIHSVARLMLNNQIRNIQTSWVKLGPNIAKAMLNAGANDLSGTLMEENITKAAGGKKQEMTPKQLEKIILDSNRIPKQRTTTYEIL